MAGKSNIEWTGHTWNPLAGCSVLTPGCTNCYAMKMAARLEAMGQPLYAGLTKSSKAGPVWTGIMRAAPESVLLAPLRRKKPTTYFVNSMSDLFHENVPGADIDRVFAVMALCPQHTFQVLTKRAGRMREYMTARGRFDAVLNARGNVVGAWDSTISYDWPIRNVWLGVSTERQKEADERIPDLLATPAAVRFISAEPLLGPIDLDGTVRRARLAAPVFQVPKMNIDWVIVGGESGPGARMMQPEWAEQIKAQCEATGTAFFMKQMTSKKPIPDHLMLRQFPAAA